MKPIFTRKRTPKSSVLYNIFPLFLLIILGAFNPIKAQQVCYEEVAGEPFSWNENGGSVITHDFYQPSTNYGFTLDIYKLDNSFNLNINGTLISNTELEFQSSGTTGISVEFVDGDQYESEAGVIWQMQGTAEHPLIRVAISPTGSVKVYGSKTSGGELFELKLKNGQSFNDVVWNATGGQNANHVIVTQSVQSTTVMDGYGYGRNTIPCPSAQNNEFTLPSGGGTTTFSILNNDTVGGSPATTSNTTLSTVGTWPTGITLNPDGTITVDNTVTDGYYTLTYQICTTENPIYCTTAIVGITIGDPCYEEVEGLPFSWAFNNASEAPSNPVIQTITQPGTDYGFTLDITYLDNSFNMTINGVQLATQEIEFSNSSPLVQNIRFQDGSYWNDGTIGNVWSIAGTTENPTIRVNISPAGVVTMYGSKVSGGPLYPLQLTNGNTFNAIPWNVNGSNTIIVSQNVNGPTGMTGRGYGRNITPCACYNDPTLNPNGGEPTKVGITLLQRAGSQNVNNWPMVREGGFIALESNTKGFIITRVAKADLGNITNPVEGMMVYDTTDKCLKIYSEGSWKCFDKPSCP